MKILIVDNEAPLRKGLKEMILKLGFSQVIVAEAEGVATGAVSINTFQPDIVLLDIEMDDGTGFDLLQQIPDPTFQLIFTTAHNQYAIQAFKFSAIDYLLKPIDPAALETCLQKAISNICKNDLGKQLSILMMQLSSRQEEDKRIVLNDKQSTYFIKIKDILYCEAEGPYTRFYIADQNPILISKNLKEYEELLTPLGFVRTHHSYIVNPKKIRVYDKSDGGVFILESGHSIPVSQRRKEVVMQLLDKRF
jgi:two-component system LytT family response regulator